MAGGSDGEYDCASPSRPISDAHNEIGNSQWRPRFQRIVCPTSCGRISVNPERSGKF
jgi:hypothetical protein